MPMQGMYSASKHAVKGFTDALRMELEEAGAPLYAPHVVAETILYCAERPKRDVLVGAGGKFTSALGQYAPRLADKIMETVFIKQQKSGRPARRRPDALHAPTFGLEERSEYQGHVAESSLYTKASLRPMLTGALVLGAGLTIAALISRASSNGKGY